MISLGAHIHGGDPIGEAEAREAELVQFFLGDPQSWKKAPPRDDGAQLKASPIPVYVHSPISGERCESQQPYSDSQPQDPGTYGC